MALRFTASQPAIVILHYGDPGLTQRLHRQLQAQGAHWQERLFVLDNASPSPYPKAWVRLPENMYWAGALAWCVEEMRTQRYTHLWFLNNDLWFTGKPKFLDLAWQRLQVVESRSGQQVGAYAPAVVRHPYLPQMVQVPDKQLRRVLLLDGVAPLLYLPAVEDAGGVDWEDNPRGYGVDLWLSLRLHRAGWPLLVDHQVAIRHEHHSAAKQDPAFLPLAADYEDAYLRARLGPDWRRVVRQLAKHVVDTETLEIPPMD